MKIDKVETFVLKAPLSSRHGYAQRWSSVRMAVMVKITTDDGLVGWGQCGAPVQESVKTVLDLEVAPLLVGQDPFCVEELWQRVIGSFSQGGGVTLPARSTRWQKGCSTVPLRQFNFPKKKRLFDFPPVEC